MPRTATMTFHRPSPFTATVVVGSDGTTVRGVAVWPIADLLDYDEQMDAAFAVDEPPADRSVSGLDPAVLDDIITSRLIAPLRRRHRRDRAVSSRAIFYQAGA
jgi:hypothetical protein